MGSRNSDGIAPRNSIVRYEMQRRASSTYGSTRALVGHASMHRLQFPHKSAAGVSAAPNDGVRSSVVTITPRNNHDPRSSLMRQVFFASHPSPAYFAATRSTIGPVST